MQAQSHRYGRPRPLHWELDGFASREPHGAQRAVHRKHGRLGPHAATPSATECHPAVNSFAGLPTIFTVLGKFGLELKRQEDILPIVFCEAASGAIRMTRSLWFPGAVRPSKSSPARQGGLVRLSERGTGCRDRESTSLRTPCATAMRPTCL